MLHFLIFSGVDLLKCFSSSTITYLYFNYNQINTMTITILKWRDISRNDDNKNSTQYKVAALMNVENKCVVLQIKMTEIKKTGDEWFWFQVSNCQGKPLLTRHLLTWQLMISQVKASVHVVQAETHV